MTHTPEFLSLATLAEVGVVARFMRGRLRPVIKLPTEPSQREVIIQDIFLRSLCWIETLARLNKPQDFQGVATCTRSLLEMCVDVVFIAHDDTGQLTAKMYDWAKSAKFQTSKSIVEFYKKRGEKVPEIQEDLERYFKENKESIVPIRNMHWDGDHQQRWTGRWLGADCQQADELEPTCISAELGKSLAELHIAQIGRLNWLVHGSGVAILQQLPRSWFFHVCSVGFSTSSSLAVLISAVTARALRSDVAQSEWENLKTERDKALSQRLGSSGDKNT